MGDHRSKQPVQAGLAGPAIQAAVLFKQGDVGGALTDRRGRRGAGAVGGEPQLRGPISGHLRDTLD